MILYVTGGQAKTIMLVQLNPDATSFSESMSTLKFAERVSGVELGAAQSSKEEKDVRELLEQVQFLYSFSIYHNFFFYNVSISNIKLNWSQTYMMKKYAYSLYFIAF